MPLLLIECCPEFKGVCQDLIAQLRSRFPGRISVKYNVDYLEDDIDPRPSTFAVIWELTNELLYHSNERCASFTEMENILKPLIEPPENPLKPMAGGG
ncbi:hypothetical protein P9112_005420 [Eukaryota sp. TZLM1-RC]